MYSCSKDNSFLLETWIHSQCGFAAHFSCFLRLSSRNHLFLSLIGCSCLRLYEWIFSYSFAIIRIDSLSIHVCVAIFLIDTSGFWDKRLLIQCLFLEDFTVLFLHLPGRFPSWSRDCFRNGWMRHLKQSSNLTNTLSLTTKLQNRFQFVCHHIKKKKNRVRSKTNKWMKKLV